MAARTTISPVVMNNFLPGAFPGIAALSGTSTPSVPASTVNATNSNAWSVSVVISGGTLTAVTVNGTQVGTTAGTYFVPASGTISITYSVAPTWAWAAAGTDAAAGGGNNFAAAWPQGGAAGTGVQFANQGTGQTWLWYYNGSQACTAYYLVGQKAGGDVFPYTEESYTLATSAQGWLPPLSPQKYNQQDTSQFSSAPGGTVGASGQGLACVDFTNVTTLVVRAYQMIPVSP